MATTIASPSEMVARLALPPVREWNDRVSTAHNRDFGGLVIVVQNIFGARRATGRTKAARKML
jgi:hypothetical protein